MIHPSRHDALGTHFDWMLEGVTAREIDWFWSNMEKGFVLWHPEQHEPLEWVRAPRHGDLRGAVHNAPQTWADGQRRDLYIRFERLEDLPAEVRGLIEFEHAIVVAGLGFEPASVHAEGPPMGYRVHQWSEVGPSAAGVRGRSSGIGVRVPENAEQGRVWAAHAGQEIANWAVFLPTLHQLYRVVADPRRNPFTGLEVEGRGAGARYRHMT